MLEPGKGRVAVDGEDEGIVGTGAGLGGLENEFLRAVRVVANAEGAAFLSRD